MTMFRVYGDYGYVSQCELFTSVSQNEAIRWATQYIANDSSFGGYTIIEVAYFDRYAEYDEYVTVLTLLSDGSATYEDDCSEQSAISYNI